MKDIEAWMPLYVADWDTDTRHLDCEQDGAYGRLIRFYWRSGPLPDDDAQLARIVGMSRQRWSKVRAIIAAFFVIGDGLWRHERVDAELISAAAKRKAYVERAAAGGRAKAAKSRTKAVLKSCTSPSPTVEKDSSESFSHSGRDAPLSLDEERAKRTPMDINEKRRLADEVRAAAGLKRKWS